MFKESLQHNYFLNGNIFSQVTMCLTVSLEKKNKSRLSYSILASKYLTILLLLCITKWFTFQHFLKTVPHDMDVLYPDKLKLDIGIIVFILIAFPCSTIGHCIKLQWSAKQKRH